MDRTLAMVSGGLGLTGVLFGAMGAHGVKRLLEGLPDAATRLGWWDTGARYHLAHALALALAAVLAERVRWRGARFAGWAFLVGVGLFSGSLYAMALTGVRGLGLITPFGGIAMTLGWVALLLAAARLPKGQDRAPSA